VPLGAWAATRASRRGTFRCGEAVSTSVLSAACVRFLTFPAAGLADTCDGAPAGGFPLLSRLEIRTDTGGFGAWRVLLVLREADIVVGWTQ